MWFYTRVGQCWSGYVDINKSYMWYLGRWDRLSGLVFFVSICLWFLVHKVCVEIVVVSTCRDTCIVKCLGSYCCIKLWFVMAVAI